jgi:hypothetical protein
MKVTRTLPSICDTGERGWREKGKESFTCLPLASQLAKTKLGTFKGSATTWHPLPLTGVPTTPFFGVSFFMIAIFFLGLAT